MNFAKFLRTPVFTEHLRWLLYAGEEPIFGGFYRFLNEIFIFLFGYCRKITWLASHVLLNNTLSVSRSVEPGNPQKFQSLVT